MRAQIAMGVLLIVAGLVVVAAGVRPFHLLYLLVGLALIALGIQELRALRGDASQPEEG